MSVRAGSSIMNPNDRYKKPYWENELTLKFLAFIANTENGFEDIKISKFGPLNFH